MEQRNEISERKKEKRGWLPAVNEKLHYNNADLMIRVGICGQAKISYALGKVFQPRLNMS